MNRSLRLRALAAAAGCVALAACGDGTGSDGPRVPARMDIVAGDLQTAPVGTELAQPLVVKVLDDKGKAVEGQLVNFRVTAGGGSVFAGFALTNKDGEARERWTLGPVAGDTQKGVTVSAPGANPAWSSYIADFTGTGPITMPAGCTFIPNTNDGNTATAFSVSCSSGVSHTYPLTSSPKVYLADNVGSITASMGIGGVEAAGLVPGTLYPARVVAVDVDGNQGVTYTGALFPTAK